MLKPGVGRCLDTVQAASQRAAERVDRNAERLALRCEVEDQLVLVVGQIVLERRYFGEARKLRFDRFRGGFEGLRCRAEYLDIERVAAGPGAPAPKAQCFQHRVPRCRSLKIGEEGK